MIKDELKLSEQAKILQQRYSRKFVREDQLREYVRLEVITQEEFELIVGV